MVSPASEDLHDENTRVFTRLAQAKAGIQRDTESVT